MQGGTCASICVYAYADATAANERPLTRPTPVQPSIDTSPISGVTGSPARSSGPAANAAGRAAAELAEFQNRQMLDDIDPDAPAAMKASPSVSGDSDTGGVRQLRFHMRLYVHVRPDSDNKAV